MANINGVDLELTNQEAFVQELSDKDLVAERGRNPHTKKGEVINVQQEVEELKKLRVNVVAFPEYLKRKAALKAYLKTTYDSNFIYGLNMYVSPKNI